MVAGEASCLLDKDMPHVEREARLKLLAETAYLSENGPWDIARDFHFNVMLGVEKGGDSTLEIQTSLMIGRTVPSGTHSKGSSLNGSVSKYPASKKPNTSRRWWCPDYQKGKCAQQSPHEMSIRGTMKWVEHFCALCLQKSLTIRYHAECDSDCPNSQGRTQWGIQGGQHQTNNCHMCCNAWLFITKLIISIITCLCYSWGRSN